jgi:RNA polymerase sigma factor (sigma-70 family)
MPRRPDTSILQVLLAGEPADLAGATDRELLHRYADARDEEAFAALVRRHAGMVQATCRRVLGDAQDAEDAFQATFLLLARKGKSGLWRPSLAGWLYAAARQVALNARRRKACRAHHEHQAAARAIATPLDQLSAAELLAALDEELGRLPERYRGPLVLCCLEGQTRDEAARRLDVPAATLKSQLERGRRLLSAALAKRGFTLGATLLTLTVASPAGAVSPRLVPSVLAAASGSASPAVAALVEQCMHSVIHRKLSLIALVTLIGGFCAVTMLWGKKPVAPPATPAPPPVAKRAAEPAAPDLVRKVRDGQAWLLKAKSFSVRLEGKRTSSYDNKTFSETMEIAFEGRRLRHSMIWKGLDQDRRIWDGQRATMWGENAGGKRFIFSSDPREVGSVLFDGLYWLWMQPHTFWWDMPRSAKQREIDRSQRGEPGDFVVTGREIYRGVPCLVLHMKGWSLLRYYVGEKTGFLHGLLSQELMDNPKADAIAVQVGKKHGKTVRTMEELLTWVDELGYAKGNPIALDFFARCHPTDKPRRETWMLDYKEVKPGCWFPMTQGFATYLDQRDVKRNRLKMKTTWDRPASDTSELRVLNITVDKPLPADTFTPPPISEGAQVHDHTTDPPLSYTYRKADGPKVMAARRAEAIKRKEEEAKEQAERDKLIGTAAAAFPKAEWINGGPKTWAELKGKTVVLLFWSVGCAPCEPYKRFLHKWQAKSSVVFIGVHDCGTSRSEVKKALKEADADGPVIIDARNEKDKDGEGVLFKHYKVRYMPSAVLIDAKGKVAALGLVEDVLRKISTDKEKEGKK